MINKPTNYNQALDAIEEIDGEIGELLSQDNKYVEIMRLMQKRLVYISEMSILKDKEVLTQELKDRIKKIFDSADSIQNRVKEKRDKIKARLDKNKRLEAKNKKINY